MTQSNSEPNPDFAPSSRLVQEVRYSLPDLLLELQEERKHSYFARQVIDQVEITKLFGQVRKAHDKGKAN